MALTEAEFLSERRTGLGGSDAQHYLGLEPYGCPRLCWYEKTGATPDHPVKGCEDLYERGHALESIITRKYREKTGRAVIETRNMVRDPEHPELMAHIDGLLLDTEGNGQGILECKSAGREIYYQMKREGLPLNYAAQLQHYLMIWNLEWGSFGVLWPDGWQFLHFDVVKDTELIYEMRARALELWERVVSGDPPDRLDPASRQCQRCQFWQTCQGEVLLQFHGDKDSGAPVSDSPLLNDLVLQMDEARSIEKEAHELCELRKDELRDELGDRTELRVPGFLVYYRSQTSMRWDTKELGSDHPELAEKYKKPSTSRPLRLFAK